MATIRKTLIAVLLALISVSAHAAGLGKLTSFSALGQPFRGEIELVAVSKEEALTLSARLAPPAAFAQANIEYNAALVSIKFEIAKTPDGGQVVRVTSSQPINEPFIDMLVELDWAGGRLVREYTLLLDPPGYTGEVANKVPPPAITAPEAAPLPTPVQPESRPLPAPAAPEAVPVAPTTPAPAETQPAPSAESRPTPAAEAKVVPAKRPPAGTYEVKRGDTLRKIADQNRIDGVSVDQMLISLYRANHAAFIGNNMNRLRTGVILNVPGRDEALSTGEADAKRLVVAQAADFNAYRRSLAGAAATAPAVPERAPAQTSEGKIKPKVEDKAAAAKPGQDQLKLSTADQAGKGVAGAKVAKGDDTAAKKKAEQEANARAAALEKTNRDLQKLAELKNQAAAEAQAKAEKAAADKAAAAKAIADKAAADKAAAEKAAADKAAATKAAADKAAADKAAADKAVADKAAADKAAADKAAADKKAAEVAAATTAPPAAVTAPAATTPPAATPVATPKADETKAPETKAADSTETKAKPKIVKKAPPPPPEPGIVDMLMDNIMYIGGALAVLIAGIVVFAMRRRKGISKFEDSIITGGDLKANSVFANTGGQSVDTGGSSLQSIVSESDAGGVDSDEVDPIAEADVYMAYGRDSQAEEILKEALAKDPGRQAIRSKLLEIYAARKDARTFETVASELYAATGGTGPDWAKAAQLGAQIDPANSLYGSQVPKLPPSAAEAPSPEDTVVLPGQIAAAQTDTVILPKKARAGGAAAAAPVAPAPAAAPPAEEIIDLSAPVETPRAAAAEPAPSGDLDFDLDLGDSAAPAAVEGAPALELPPGSETTGGGGLDFDIGGAPAAPSVESSAIDFQVPEAASVPSVPGETPESEFDSTSTVAMLETAAAAGSTTQANIVAEAKAQAGDPAKPPADMIMLDEAAGDEDHEKTIVVDFNMLDEPSGTPSGGNGAAPVADARWQEVATKLDLAKAYEEMGDKDGTRELLNEVLKEGDHAQQEQAKSILTRLG